MSGVSPVMILLAVVVFVLAAGGLALGLILTGKPPETACEGVACLGGERCAGCPKRKAEQADG